ncbi:MAG: DUF5011 domain-containing protein, partial [Clostridiales Family XIII bacterium]|nr:DUF5011 domain-containing protein [Clostridiales Family XIII bacterium]
MYWSEPEGNEKTKPLKIAVALLLSAAMLVAMMPNMAPAAMYADSSAGGAKAGAVDTATPDGGAATGQAPKGENGDSAAAEHSEPASLYSVSFVLPSGYSYGDGTDRFTVQVAEGDSVAKASVPIVPASAGDVFTGWRTMDGGSELFLTRDQIAVQPVTADVEYTAAFEKLPGVGADGAGGTNGTDAANNKAGAKPNATRGVSPQAGDWTVTSASGKLDNLPTGMNIRLVNPSGATSDYANLTAAVTYMKDNGTGGTWLMYVKGSGHSPVGVDFASLKNKVTTLVITGDSADPAPLTPEPATSANSAHGIFGATGNIVVNFACNVQLRNIRYTVNDIYMNGYSLTLGHKSWATSATQYYGGAASGDVSGNPVLTVWSTGNGASRIVGGSYRGTLTGDAAININNTSGNEINVFGAGYGAQGADPAAGDKANLNGNATTTITGMATNANGLGFFVGGTGFGYVTGKIKNTISGQGRFSGESTSASTYASPCIIGGSRIGDIGTDAYMPTYAAGVGGRPEVVPNTGQTVITNNIDTSAYTAGRSRFVGTNTDAGTVKGHVDTVLKAGEYNKGSYAGFSGGSGSGASISGAWNNFSITSTSTDLTIGNIESSFAAAETVADYKHYGNITNEIKEGSVSNSEAAGYLRGAGYGFEKGNIYTVAGTEGCVYYTNRKNWTYSNSNNGQADDAGFDLVGGGGTASRNNGFVVVGNTTLVTKNILARWTYGGSFGGSQWGDSLRVHEGGVVDTCEGSGFSSTVHIGSSRAEVRGGQVDWFLSGGGYNDQYQIGDASVEVFDAPNTIINASMGGTYGSTASHRIKGDVDVKIHGGDFSGTAGGVPARGFSCGPSDNGYIFGNATMTLDFRGNKHGFSIEKGDSISGGRRLSTGADPATTNVYLGSSSANTITLNIFSDPGNTSVDLNSLDIYGDAASSAATTDNTRAGKITMNINSPGSTTGNIYATNYSNISSNKLKRDVVVNLVSAGTTGNISACGPTDNINNTVASTTTNKAVLNVGPQPQPADWDESVSGEWPLDDKQPGVDPSDGFPWRINVNGSREANTTNGIANFTSATIKDRLLIAKSGGILNGRSATAANHGSTYDQFGDVTLKDGAGLGVESSSELFIAGKLNIEGQGYVVSPGSKNQIVFSDVNFADSDSALTWLRSPYTGTGSVDASSGMQTNWFGLGTAWPVITLNTGGSTSTQGKTNVEKLTPANFNGQDIAGGKTYIGDTDTHFTSGTPDSYSGYGVCVAGAFYNWDVVPGDDGVSLGKVRYDIVDSAGTSKTGSVNVGTSKPTGGAKSLDVYGSADRNTDTVSGAIAIPSSKNLYAKFSFLPDAASGEWSKDLTVARSDRYDVLENPPNQPGKGKYDYHEFEQSVPDYYDTGKRTREWASAVSGRKTGSYRTPPVYGTLPSGQDDKEYSFDIEVDYTKTPELEATSVILKEDAARALVAQPSGSAKSDSEIIAALRGASATNVMGRPFLTDDIVANDQDNIVTNDAFHALSTPLDAAAGEYTRTYAVTYYTHSIDSNATSGDTVTLSKSVNILIVPNGAEVTTGAALVAYDADMLVNDAKGIAAQRGDATPKKNIDYWTGAKAYTVTAAGDIDEKTPTLASAGAKVAAFQAVTGKTKIDLAYSYDATSLGGKVLKKPVSARIVGARVDGTLWVDANGDGIIDANETGRFIGKNVRLYKKATSGGGADTLVDSTITDGYGRYSFGAYSDAQSPAQIAEVPEGDLYIVFPDLSGYGMTNCDSARRHDFHVDYDTAGQYDYRGAAGISGGYRWPDTSGLASSFKKQVYDAAANGGAGAYVDDMKVTDSNTLLQYRLQFKLPADLSGYNSLTVKDIMPAGLEYASGEQGSFAIGIADGSGPDAAFPVDSTKLSAGALPADPTRTQVSYNITDFTGLAGKTVNVYIKAKLAPVAGSYPSSIKNTGRLILNASGMDGISGSELTNGDPQPPQGGILTSAGAVDEAVSGPAIGNGAVIAGVLWDDEDGDGIIGATELNRFDGRTVTLYAAADQTYSSPLATATTGADGSFLFDKISGGSPLPAGSYVVKYPAITDYGFVTVSDADKDQSASSVKTNIAADDGASHAIALDLGANQRMVSNAGYVLMPLIPPEFSFTQSPLVIPHTAGVSHVLRITDSALKAEMRVTDDRDNPTWEDADATDSELFVTRTAVISLTQSGTPLTKIDTQNVGVYKATYLATDSDGNQTTATRAIVVDDGRYEIDPNDNGGIIIGARNFVAKRADVTGQIDQARNWSFAEAYDIDGNSLNSAGSPTAAMPQGYGDKPPAGDYTFKWTVSGYSIEKEIIGKVTGASYVDQGSKDSRYALIAWDFQRNAVDAQAMLDTQDIGGQLILAASAQAITLTAGAPALTPSVRSNGNFSAALGKYNIEFIVPGTPLEAYIIGTVSNGDTPVLTVPTPTEIQKGATFDARDGVTAWDTEDTDITPDVTIAADSDTVDTGAVGLYHLRYEVTDSDHNAVTADRLVVVNDGTYVVNANNGGRVLEAHSFVTKLSEVTTNNGLLDAEILLNSRSKLYEGDTGAPVGTGEVADRGTYARTAGAHVITMAGIDDNAATGYISKTIIGKVVEADVLEGPAGPDASGAVYYAYGKNLQLTRGEAATLDTPEKLLNALEAHTEKVMPNGFILDAGVAIAGITDSAGNPTQFSSAVGTYRVTISDDSSPAHVTAVLTVSVATGEPPVLTLDPIPLVLPAAAAPANLTPDQIMSGVTATDKKDDANPNDDLVTTVTIASITASGAAVTDIPADRAGVYKVTYKATDSDYNEVTQSRAVIVNDGSIQVGASYVLQAKSFIVGLSEVDFGALDAQIIRLSEAKAWKVDGDPVAPQVSGYGGYGKNSKGTYTPTLACPTLSKQVQAEVVDDRNYHGGNGVLYSILAKDFRINLTEADLLAAKAAQSGSAYADEFIARALAEGFGRTGSSLDKIEGAVALGGAVVKENDTAKDFSAAGFVEGEVYLATFHIKDEPNTAVTIKVLVSNATPPRLTVPAVKTVAVGDAFPEGAYDDTAPSFMQGVRAEDNEDGSLPASAITHAGTVDTYAEGAFKVDYSVADSDYNRVTQSGVVLVGDWSVVSGYAIIAHDFSKEVGDVAGTESEIIAESAAKAIDLRQTLPAAGANPNQTPNPNYGEPVPVKVAPGSGWDGYNARTPAEHDITLMVDDPANAAESNQVTASIKANIGAGECPAIEFSKAPLEIEQTFNVPTVLTADELKDGLQVTDPEDYPNWVDDADGTSRELFRNVTIAAITKDGRSVNEIDTQYVGVYSVDYIATDSHGNQSAAATRAVVVNDGRFTIGTGDDGIIIGARNFVAKKDGLKGTMAEARGLSYAKAYTTLGAVLPDPEWT